MAKHDVFVLTDKHELRAIVAANVLRLARAKKMTLSALADFAGIDRAGLSRCLNGHAAMTTDRICSIANALGVKPWALLHPPDEVPAPKKVRRT